MINILSKISSFKLCKRNPDFQVPKIYFVNQEFARVVAQECWSNRKPHLMRRISKLRKELLSANVRVCARFN